MKHGIRRLVAIVDCIILLVLWNLGSRDDLMSSQQGGEQVTVTILCAVEA
jgi:hypothetical protein